VLVRTSSFLSVCVQCVQCVLSSVELDMSLTALQCQEGEASVQDLRISAFLTQHPHPPSLMDHNRVRTGVGSMFALDKMTTLPTATWRGNAGVWRDATTSHQAFTCVR